jgi:UDPglucose--hexose-1-phosphate uridylyltransferase
MLSVPQEDTLPELRRDPIIGRWVIVSTERNKRPTDFGKDRENQGAIPCPFCPGNEMKTPPEVLSYGPANRSPNSSNWWTRVVPNKFPALQIEGQLHRSGEGMYDKMDGLGAHEVIIETPDHDKQLQHMDENRIEDVFWAYRDRIVDLKKDPRLEYVLIFKNCGAAAGATLSHAHSQLIATPMVPIRVKQEMQGAAAYFEYKERCIFCDIIRHEQLQKVRLVDENNDFIAITPFASRFPFETWVLPKKHDYNFEDIQKPEMINLARMMKSVLSRLDKVLDQPPYNFVIHNSPLKANFLEHYHWHIEVIPKLTQTAGFEWGTGFYINPTPPEQAATFLREIESIG